MTAGETAIDQARWEELIRTAALVRAEGQTTTVASRSWRRVASGAAYAVVFAGLTIAALHAFTTATVARADGSADAALFSLTNQDRTSNGVRSLNGNGTLGGIGEGSRYTGCGFAVSGRSVDMIQRNYFAHPILNCGGQYVFSMMQAFGVHYTSAGENIGWNTYGAGAAAAQINSAFMNSSDHRANILNGNYTDLGIGSASSGAAAWTGGGGSLTGVWMFSEEFAQLRSSPPPPRPPPPPAPRPRPRPTGNSTPTRNTAPPPPPAQPAAATVTAAPTPAPTSTPLPTEMPTPTPLPTLTLPPPLAQPGGLLFNSVEWVLESYLIS
jgi:uncharacterized protein YkwD